MSMGNLFIIIIYIFIHLFMLFLIKTMLNSLQPNSNWHKFDSILLFFRSSIRHYCPCRIAKIKPPANESLFNRNRRLMSYCFALPLAQTIYQDRPWVLLNPKRTDLSYLIVTRKESVVNTLEPLCELEEVCNKTSPVTEIQDITPPPKARLNQVETGTHGFCEIPFPATSKSTWCKQSK